MIEILILYILYRETNTLYGIHKIIKERFLHLNSATFGSIHPAVARLLEKGFLQEKRTISNGGRKKNIYSITKSGQTQLLSSYDSEISFNLNNLEKQISTKLACADILDEATKKIFYLKIFRYYEHRIALFTKMLKNKDYTPLQEGQLKIFIEGYQKEVNLLKNLS